MTKRERNFLNSYNRATATYLDEVYTSFSSAKARADRECKEKMLAMNGKNYRIISHNSNFFTCAWIYLNEDNKKCLNVETARYTYQFLIDED